MADDVKVIQEGRSRFKNFNALDFVKYFVLCIIFSAASVFFAYWIFPSQASLLAISFLVVAFTPLFFEAVRKEEDAVARESGLKNFFSRYRFVFPLYVVLMVGVFAGFFLLYNTLPSDPVYYSLGYCTTSLPCKENVFSLQMDSFQAELQGPVPVLGLMLMCFFLSLFFGVGALLILFIDLSMFVVGASAGDFNSLMMLLPRSISFFLVGLSGALLSVAVTNHEWKSRRFREVILDSLLLLLAASVLSLFFMLAQ